MFILQNATRVGRNPMLRADSLHAYLFNYTLTSVHGYMLTRLHAYMLTCTCVHACTRICLNMLARL